MPPATLLAEELLLATELAAAELELLAATEEEAFEEDAAELLLAAALLALELAALLEAALLEAALLEAALLEEALTSGPMEHQAEVVKLLLGKAEPIQAKLPVLVAYTKLPDLPSATVCVPLIEQLAPVFCTHFL